MHKVSIIPISSSKTGQIYLPSLNMCIHFKSHLNFLAKLKIISYMKSEIFGNHCIKFVFLYFLSYFSLYHFCSRLYITRTSDEFSGGLLPASILETRFCPHFPNPLCWFCFWNEWRKTLPKIKHMHWFSIIFPIQSLLTLQSLIDFIALSKRKLLCFKLKVGV